MSTKLIDKVSSWAKNAQLWVLPGVCIVCHQPSRQSVDLCENCHASLPGLENPCTGCALPLPRGKFAGTLCGQCQDQDRLIYQTIAGFAYYPPVGGLISQFKYQGKLQHGRVLTDLLLNEVRHRYQDAALPQLLLPVPLYRARLRERGYNQALLMAQQIGKALKIPVDHNLLERVINTAAQQGLSARERKQNLRRAFALSPEVALQDLASVVLIDDVVTTMSTVREVARLIKRKIPAELKISVWCLARA